MIILEIFVFDKTDHLVLRDSALVQRESTPSAHPRLNFLKLYFLVSCFLTMPLNRTKLKYGNMMKLKAYEKTMWMIELGAVYHLRPKGFVYPRLHFL